VAPWSAVRPPPALRGTARHCAALPLQSVSSIRQTRQTLPLWSRWAAAIVVGLAVIAAVVIAVNRAGPEGVAASEGGAEAEIGRLADISIAEDQAPRTAGLHAGAAPASALQLAVAADVRRRIAKNQLVGPLQGVTCAAAGAGSAGRDPYRCTVRSAGVSYLFLAVVDENLHRLTWCKVDPPAPGNTGPEIPISASCKA
jgi:hypothetical protein